MTREKFKNTMRTAEEKKKLILEYEKSNLGFRKFAEKHNIHPFVFHPWIKIYREYGLEGLKSKTGTKKGGSKGQGARKAKTVEEELTRKITKLEIENERLKKGYLLKGVGAKKEYVTTFDMNMK